MCLVCITAKQERCTRAYVCKSGLITRLNVFQGRLLAVAVESGGWLGGWGCGSSLVLGVHMLWHCRSKKMKVRVALQRQMDAVTHTYTKSRARRRADTWLQIKYRQKLEGRDERCMGLYSLCVWGETVRPKISGHPPFPTHFCVVLVWDCFLGTFQSSPLLKLLVVFLKILVDMFCVPRVWATSSGIWTCLKGDFDEADGWVSNMK